jgi:hypothetical protein
MIKKFPTPVSLGSRRLAFLPQLRKFQGKLGLGLAL